MASAPVALCVYNRPDHTRRTLESLGRNPGFDDTPLYVFCDGAKPGENVDEVVRTRAVVRALTPSSATIIEREHNLGLAESIIRAASQVCDEHGRFILLEDDDELSVHFLDFMNRALDAYADDDCVMHVSGYAFPSATPLPETFFIRPCFGACWGWGSWARAWQFFEPSVQWLLDQFEQNRRAAWEFNVRGTMPFIRRLRSSLADPSDIWSTRWYASISLAGGLCLRPGRSLLTNIGNDGTGVHLIHSDRFDVPLASKPVTALPTRVEEHTGALEAAMAFSRSLQMSTKPRVHGFRRWRIGRGADRST
jgi:hypothetical protein